MRAIGAAALCVVLGACAAAPKLTWVRADGQDVRTNPVLMQQAEMDRTVCGGEVQRANLSGVTFAGGGLAGAIAANERANAAGQVGTGCMASKGYVQTTEEQREAKLAELASIEQMRKQQEAAASRPAPPPGRPARPKPAGS